jgi:Protein of unknown function (DUF3575)
MKKIYLILIFLMAYKCFYAQTKEYSKRNVVSVDVSFLVLPRGYTDKLLYGGGISYLHAVSTHDCLGLNFQYYTESAKIPIPKYTLFYLQTEYRKYFGTKPLNGFYLAINLGIEDFTITQVSSGGALYDTKPEKNISSGLGLGFDYPFGRYFSGYLKGGLGYVFKFEQVRYNFGGGVAFHF